MDKLILLTIILATVLVPAIGARNKSPQRGLSVTLVAMAIVVFLYMIASLYIAVRYINTTPPPGVYW